LTRVLMGIERPYLTSLFGTLEICRRTLWGVFRLEWESLVVNQRCHHHHHHHHHKHSRSDINVLDRTTADEV
jgi:hypothetical protein